MLQFDRESSGREATSPAAQLAQHVLPADLAGKSVFVVGTDFAALCLEALKRGAGRVVGADVEPAAVHEARELAADYGSKVRFELLDIERDAFEERFDHVLCVDLLNTCRNPIAIMDRLAAMARERLVLELAAPGQAGRPRWPGPRLPRFLRNRSPLIALHATSSKNDQGFSITPAAIDSLLMQQRHLFARLEIVDSPQQGRFLAIAHKRQIGRLVLVAGPTAAGKSWLIDKLVTGQADNVVQRLGIDDWADWPLIEGRHMRDLTEPRIDKLLYHRNILKPFLRSSRMHERDPALDLLETADKVIVLTVWSPAEVLERQLETRSIVPYTKGSTFSGNKRHPKVLELYKDPAKIEAYYEKWFDYVRGQPVDHYVVTLYDGLEIHSIEEWDEMVRGPERRRLP